MKIKIKLSFFRTNRQRFLKLSIEKKRIIENIISLYVVQGANSLLPLIALPYLVRVLGPEKYGLISFAEAFIQYFIGITNYSFYHTAPRRVAIYRDEQKKLHQIFNSIMLIRLILLIISFIILVLLVCTIPKFRMEWNIYFATFLLVLGNILFPIWFFQGMEKMKYISLLNMLSKLIFTISIFIFIKAQSDYIYVPIINSLGMIITGVVSLFIIRKDFHINFFLPSKNSILKELKEGWHVFIGMFSSVIHSTSNTFILGIFSTNTIVGYFKAGDTLIRASLVLLNPIAKALYPYISRMANISQQKAVEVVKKVLIGSGCFYFLLSITFFLSANTIVDIFLGSQYKNTVIVLQILSPLSFLMSISGSLAALGLLAFNMNKAFSSIIILTGMVSIISALILTPTFQHIGISISSLITESFATIAIVIYLKHKGFFSLTKAI